MQLAWQLIGSTVTTPSKHGSDITVQMLLLPGVSCVNNTLKTIVLSIVTL